MLDVGQSQDWLALQMALAPCLLGYGAVAKMLSMHERTKKEGNFYWKWIENYNEEDYTEAVRKGSGMVSPSGGPPYVRLGRKLAYDFLADCIRQS